MSGTSLDGVDVAVIKTDGYARVEPLAFLTKPYDKETRRALRACFGKTDMMSGQVRTASRLLTEKHEEALRTLNFDLSAVDVIGFHGQTIYHAPQDGVTLQMGDPEWLARQTGTDVVFDFRSGDVKAGGEGAPLAPLYHAARVRASDVTQPCVILNIGGVANVTYIKGDEVLAFDTGPGNALMDDWAQKYLGRPCDEDGRMAAQGQVREDVLAGWLTHDYFRRPPPKSLDRGEWDIAALGPLVGDIGQAHSGDDIVKDGLATLLEFTAQTIARSRGFMPEAPAAWYVCGGGRHNKALMARLTALLDMAAAPVEALLWNGDALEAEAFAYLAVRCLIGEPLSLPSTTGVPLAQTGGRLYKAP